MRVSNFLLLNTILAINACSNAGLSKEALKEDFRFVYNENYDNLGTIISTINTLPKNEQVMLLEDVLYTEQDENRRYVLREIIAELKRN